MSGTVLVTGAGGFIGQHVCQCLAEAGWQVCAAVRSSQPPPSTSILYQVKASESSGRLRDVVKDCIAVVHLAGRAHVLHETAADPRAAFHMINTDFTRKLGEAAVAVGVRNFILMSSVAAVSSLQSSTVSDDSTDAPDTDYGRSKWEAESALAEVSRGTDLRVVALRPPMVYGEGMRGNPLRLFRHLARGLPLPVPRPAVKRSIMYVGNLADAVLVALTHSTVRGRFCVTDSEAITIDDFACAAAAALGRPARLVPVPAWTLRLAGSISEIAGRALPVRVNRATLARLTQSLIVDGGRFARMAEFKPPFSPRESLERTASWLMGDLDRTHHNLAPRASAPGLR